MYTHHVVPRCVFASWWYKVLVTNKKRIYSTIVLAEFEIVNLKIT